jgi:exopolyphosphatase/guanosine-5'-triphosphate,3'-diphosphate pyrophosphatase
VLRIAIRLHRSRSERDLPPLRLQASGDALQLGLPDGYLAAHPLTRADLQAEQRDLAAAGLTLLLTGVPDEVRPEI